jgi:hypothetical protein
LSRNTIDAKAECLFGAGLGSWSERHAADDHDLDSLGAMAQPSYPLRFVVVALAGWINQHQRHVVDYLQEENRALREQLVRWATSLDLGLRPLAV